MPKNIDPVDIRKLVKDGKLEFYVEGDNIYCQELPINGELFIVGKVERQYNDEPIPNLTLITIY